MRKIVVFALALLPLASHADSIGRLLWESVKAKKMVSESVQMGKRLIFPGAPFGGKANDKAVSIGIIDSGVDTTHPQVAGYIKESRDFTGEGLHDELGHGTTVALITLFGQGLELPQSTVLNAKVVSRNGHIIEKHVIEAIAWTIARGAKIVNLSLGFSGTSDEHKQLCNAIASHPETLFFAAAGNSGPNERIFPAACELSNLISVGATDESGQSAAYSGQGDVSAPGNWYFVPEWAHYYNEAQRHAKAGNLDQARSLYLRSIAVEDNAESHFQIGVIDLADKKVTSAIDQFETAIRMSPAFAEAHEMLGAALFLEGKFMQAEKRLRDAIDLYPEAYTTRKIRARAYFNLGQTLLRLKRFDQAKSALLEAKLLFPEHPGIDVTLRSIRN